MKHADSVFEKMELTGEWWLPDNPDHRVPGTLTGSVSDGLRLRLAGSFNPSPREDFWGDEAPQLAAPHLIHGRTFDGDITLRGAFRTGGSRISSTGLRYMHYGANMVLKGVHVAPTEELRFSKMHCGFSVLCDWLDPWVFEAGLGDRKFGVSFDFPEDQTLLETKSVTIKLHYSHSWADRRRGQNSVAIDWEPEFVIESKVGELPWIDPSGMSFSLIIHTLNQFVTVASFTSCYPFSITGLSSQWMEDSGMDGEPWRAAISLYDRRAFPNPDYRLGSDLLSWAQIKDDPKSCFERWFELFPRLQTPIALFSESISQQRSSPERFLNMAQALEGLHRFAHPEASQKTREHRKKLSEILDASPEQYRKWLQEKLQFSHEPSLKKRLDELIRPFEETFDWLVGVEGDRPSRSSRRQKFARAFVASRNALAHSLPEAGKRPGLRYLHFTRVAELLTAMFLMKELGIGEQDISDRFEKDYITSQVREGIVKFLAEELK